MGSCCPLPPQGGYHAIPPLDQYYNLRNETARLLEEVGVEMGKIGYVTSMVYIRPDNIPCLIVSLYAEAKSDKIRLCNALTEFAWVDIEEAKNYDLIEGIYEELEILDKELKTGEVEEWKRKPQNL